MSIKRLINNEINDFHLDLIIEGLNEIISAGINNNVNKGNFTTVLSEDGDVVCNIVNDELKADNCTLEESEDNENINNEDIVSENTYKVYHGTNQKFSKFNFKNATQGIVWFTDSPESIQRGEHGGAGNNIIMTRYITINNPAGWAEYEKYGLQQLQDMGYDGVILPQEGKTDYFVFSPKSISAKDNSNGQNDLSEVQDIINDEVQAWHGSPYDFDKFDVSKINSGEGNQAFGWGLYFTDLKDIAQGYSERISDIKYGTEKSLIQSYINSINQYINNPDKYSDRQFRVYKDDKYGYFVNTTNNYHRFDVLLDNVSYDKALPYMKERLKLLQQELKNYNKGDNLYNVTLHKGKDPEQYDWLLWDKPLSLNQLSKIAQKDKHVGEVLTNWSKDETTAPATYQGRGFIGGEIYKYLASYFDSAKEASLFLLSAGIDGIKYPAESLARGTTSDNARGFNYVVFDPNAITIEKKINNNSEQGLNEEDMLNEGLSNILYHFTYTSSLLSILKYNKFATSSNLGSNADSWKDKGRFYFFSTQRTKGMSGYARHHGNVAIVLDGRKLNYTFKGYATDYWNWSKKRSDYKSIGDYTNALQSEENEDRIVTNKPYIDNANKYIIEIHILVNENEDKDRVYEIESLCKNLNVPVFFYTDDNSFKLQDKRKAIPLANISLEPKDKSAYDEKEGERDLYNAKWFFKKIAPAIIAGNEIGGGYNDEKEVIEKMLKEMLDKGEQSDQFDNVMSDINDKTNRLKTSWGRMYADDEFLSMQAEIHNHRGDPNPYLRELLKMLITDMKKWRVKNLKEYFNKKFQAGIKETIDNSNENMSKSLKNTHDKTVKNRKDIDPSVLNESRGEFTKVYHGTSVKDAENIQKYGIKVDKSTGGYFGWGFYTAIEFDLAKDNYADFAEEKGSSDKGAVLEFSISPEANILDLRKDEDFKTWQPYSKAIYMPDLYMVLVKHGIDGLYDNSFEGVVIYNVKVLSLVKVHYL